VPPEGEANPRGTSIRIGKVEEGEAHGEVWVLVRALLLVALVTAIAAWFIA
jgi:hypothetical protein